ncbi:MAG: hypothetical protein HY812_11025 [Planctomycetes bacterium]|nr:hypothetical protein [Planctomycetota bacterium]
MRVPIGRPELRDRIERRMRSNPVVLLLGPRQCGRTTLARQSGGRRRAAW